MVKSKFYFRKLEDLDPENEKDHAKLYQHRWVGKENNDNYLRWKHLSCGQSQELCQLADLASDWLLTLKQLIRSRISSLTQLLTLTTSQKFPPRGWLNSRSMGFPLSLSRSLLLGYLKAKFET